jgi:hypothetical protein
MYRDVAFLAECFSVPSHKCLTSKCFFFVAQIVQNFHRRDPVCCYGSAARGETKRPLALGL